MAIYMIKCPSCGSATELNDEKDFCFCTECGKKILKEDAELFTPPPEPTPDAPAPRAETAPVPVPAAEPEAAPEAPEAAPAPAEAPAPEPSEEPEPPLAIPAYEGPALTNAEHLEHLIASRPEPLDSVKFRSSDECAAYVSGLHDTILDLAARYGRMNHAEEATCLDYLDRGIAYCEVLDTRRLKFLAGTHEENGKTVEDYGTFPVSKTALKEIKQVRTQFVEAYNGFFAPKIAAAKAELEESKEKIKALPAGMRFLRSFCRPLMGVLAAALFAIGLVPILTMEQYSFGLNVNTLILVVGALLLVAWIVTTILWIIKGGSARQLYKAADRQLGEVRTYRAKLKS